MFITRESRVLSSHTYTKLPFLLSDLYPEREKKGGKKGEGGNARRRSFLKYIRLDVLFSKYFK